MKIRLGIAVLSVFFLALPHVAAAQSVHYDADLGRYVEDEPGIPRGARVGDLREELARERYRTQIALERQRRAEIERTQEASNFENRLHEIQLEDARQQQRYQSQANDIYSASQATNLLGNIVSTAQMAAGNW